MKNNIKQQRVALGLTQAALAEQVQVSRQTINALEKGDYVPSTVLALRLANKLSKRVDELFELEVGDWNL